MNLLSAPPGAAETAASRDIGAPAAAALLHATSADVDEHCTTLGRWRLNYDQISAGAFRGSFTQLSLPRLEVFREVTSQQVRQYGRLGSDSFGIGLPWQAAGEVNCNGSSIATNKVIACFDADIDMCTPKAFEFRGVILPATLIEDLTHALGIDLPRDIWRQMCAIEMAEEPVSRLRELMTAIEETIAQRPALFEDSLACRALEDSLLVEITDMLPTARPCDDMRGGAARKRTVDRACELMLARCDNPVSILDVCKAVGASRRKLNYCFQEVLGTSPISYSRAVRLNRARRDLKACRDPRAGIYDIAVNHGFWHFSQFSLDYKRHFAELPSETLRRARLS